MPPVDPDHELRLAAHERARQLSHAFDDVVPIAALREGFEFRGDRVSFGSFYSGIYRAARQVGPAALTLVTSAASPYEDEIDEETGAIVYAYRSGSFDHADTAPWTRPSSTKCR